MRKRQHFWRSIGIDLFLNLEHSWYYKIKLRLLYIKINFCGTKFIRGDRQEKEVDTVTIEDDHSDEEDLGVLSPQGNISPIHATTPDTPILQKIRDYPKEGEIQVQVVDFNEQIK